MHENPEREHSFFSKHKAMTRTLVILAIVSLSLWLVYTISDREKVSLDQGVRQAADYSFVKLSHGWTHYQDTGREINGTVVLLHGGGPAMLSWDRQIGFLATNGYRVIRFDRYGSGFSDRPDIAYNWDLFVRQTAELLDSLGVSGTFDMVGRSLGARAALCFAHRYPERVNNLVLTSSGLRAPKGSPLTKMPFIPPIIRFVYRVFGGVIMDSQLDQFAEYVSDSTERAEYRNLIEKQLRIRGTERAFYSFLRSGEILGCREAYSVLGDRPDKIAFIWGTRDELVPQKRMLELVSQYPRMTFTEIAGAGHGINFTHAEEYNQALIKVLSEPAAGP